MNRRQFFIALAVLAILAAAGAAVVLSDRSAWTAADSRAGQKAIPGLRLSEVAEIAIRDSSGELHQLSAVCPHLGCIVHWNTAEKTWDCPCHGSRFDPRGRVVSGPANSPLAEV